MGYFYLSLALFAGIAKGFCGKKVSGDMCGFRDCIFINLLRMLFCALVGLVICIAGGVHLELSPLAIVICLFSAVCMTLFCVCWMYAYRNEAYSFLNVFTMLGTVMTCICGFVIYREPIGINKWAGMMILLLAVYIMSVYNKGIKGKITPYGMVILIIGCLGCALADFSQKIYMHEIGENAAAFNFYTYAFGTLLLICIFPFTRNKAQRKCTPALYNLRHIGIYFAISFCLYLNTFSKTLAAGFLSTAEIYPVLQGANLIISALLASVLLKEKINLKSIAGMTCAFTGLIVMNVL